MIRKATRADLPRISEIRSAVRENRLTNPNSIAAVPALTDWLLDNSMMWVWVEDGEIIGFSAADSRDGSICALFVDPLYEGRGVGRALFAPACNVLREDGHKTAWLTTEPDTRAERFYRADGWIEARRDADGQIVFEKRL